MGTSCFCMLLRLHHRLLLIHIGGNALEESKCALEEFNLHSEQSVDLVVALGAISSVLNRLLVPHTIEERTPCQLEREKAEQLKLPFKPACDESGQYRPLQVNRQNRLHFCVDKNGMVLEWTITKTAGLNCNSYSNCESTPGFQQTVDLLMYCFFEKLTSLKFAMCSEVWRAYMSAFAR